MDSQEIRTPYFDKIIILIVWACISLFPLFFLTTRGWTNATLFLSSLLSVIYITIRCPKFYKNKNSTYWLLLSSLCAPFLTELIAQILRLHIHPSSLDGPLRFLLAGFVFIALCEFPRKDLNLNFQWIIPVSLLACLVAYFLNPSASQFWGGRAATYFVDPITFASYVAALAFICLIYVKNKQKFIINLFNIATFSSAIYLVIVSQSRSAWISCLAIGFLIPLINGKISKKSIFSILLLVALLAFSGYHFNDLIKGRVDTALSEIIQYFNGNRDTSTGIRISLARLDLHLFYSHLFTGIQDGVLPPFAELSLSQNYVTEALYSMKLLAGSHNEILAQISRKGIWGIISIFGLFLIPITFFIKNITNSNEKVSTPAKVGLIFCLSIFISSLTIQVFNLKYTSSFYALMVAVLSATIIRIKSSNE